MEKTREIRRSAGHTYLNHLLQSPARHLGKSRRSRYSRPLRLPAGDAFLPNILAMTYRIALIRGDGIGPEVTAAARRVVDAAGLEIRWQVVAAGQKSPLSNHCG